MGIRNRLIGYVHGYRLPSGARLLAIAFLLVGIMTGGCEKKNKPPTLSRDEVIRDLENDLTNFNPQRPASEAVRMGLEQAIRILRESEGGRVALTPVMCVLTDRNAMIAQVPERASEIRQEFSGPVFRLGLHWVQSPDNNVTEMQFLDEDGAVLFGISGVSRHPWMKEGAGEYRGLLGALLLPGDRTSTTLESTSDGFPLIKLNSSLWKRLEEQSLQRIRLVNRSGQVSDPCDIFYNVSKSESEAPPEGRPQRNDADASKQPRQPASERAVDRERDKEEGG